MGKNYRTLLDVVIISNPMGQPNISPFSHFVEVLQKCTKSCRVIATRGAGITLNGLGWEKPHFFVEIIHNQGNNFFSRSFRYLILQMKISYHLLYRSKSTDVWILYIDGGLVFPMILSKILGKKTIILLGGFREQELNFTGSTADRLGYILAKFNLSCCNSLVVYSPRLISGWHLESYRSKIHIAHEHFIDFSRFSRTIPMCHRPNTIAYIGRLSAEKGVRNFISALPAILDNQIGLQIVIGGEGPLRDSIRDSLRKEKITDQADMPGWITHDDLPRHLNRIRLLVLPSYTEGLPNIMIEAMACGTPVLATPAGAIPDIIRDGETGFIMENNTSECIAMNVRRALSSPDLAKIAEKGRCLVEREFAFEKTVEDWEQIL